MNNMKPTEVHFPSGSASCAASFYLPIQQQGHVPCVVMGHGTSGTRDLGLAAYAERFAAAGMAVLAFDYRHFGTSGGYPRQVIKVAHQLEDYRAAIRFARSVPSVGPERIALWGTSLSGGHVLAVAATDPRLAAVVSQVPWMGVEFSRADPRSRQETRQLFGAAYTDAMHALLRRPPSLIKVVGHPGELAAFTDEDARKWMDALAPMAPTWRNAIAARVLLSLLMYRPGTKAKHVVMPLLICIADQDTASSTTLALRAADLAPRAEVRHYPLTHFAAYLGAGFEQMVADQVQFLRTHLFAADQANEHPESHSDKK
ncbi:alpha/beta hydrolase [Reticulibacter mediterranei]|uniref:Alpha/beta hydrolase n=1 Tax=Reticulibacter mediterranei TaxID=2778369 RepID=A0A8J3IUH7_9CHLR|nr:alpha/beta hydrolase [Reticulibacter mediterranei]GHO98750.1 alpha/beta hydrolase [Reticulibacter mediterranei]